jgi:antitoxin component of MazEF toxin-antitoxin module
MADDPDRLRALAAPHATVADKIRALAGAGVARADIARFLGKRYQHVRNVLEGDAQSGAQGGGYVVGKADLSGVREGPRPFKRDEDEAYIERRGKDVFWLEVKPDGSLPMPAELAEVLDATPGHRVFVEVKDGRLTVMSAVAAREEAQAIVRKYIPAGVNLSDELIADRRAEVAREEQKDREEQEWLKR